MIALIIINYKKSDLTVRLCRSLSGLRGREKVHVIVVDNASSSESQATLNGISRLSLKVNFLFENENLGYFGGARRGLEYVRTQKAFDWVVVSNSDVEFTDPDFFVHLEKLALPPEVGVLAPSVLSGLSGRDQNPYLIHRPSTARMHFYKWVFRYRWSCFLYQMLGLFKSLLKKTTATPNTQRSPAKIYAAHGSFLIFSRRYFELGADFTHGPFLFGEEITVAENCRQRNLDVLYEPKLVVSHVEHATMGWWPDRRMLGFQREASRYCADRFFSRSVKNP